MRYVPLLKLNEIVFPDAPVPLSKLQRWCRQRILPARKFGKEWKVNLDEFDKMNVERQDEPFDSQTVKVLEKLAR